MEENQVHFHGEARQSPIYWIIVIALIIGLCVYEYTQYQSQIQAQEKQIQEQSEIQAQAITSQTYHYMDSQGENRTVTFTVGQKVVMPKENVEQRFPYHEGVEGKIRARLLLLVIPPNRPD